MTPSTRFPLPVWLDTDIGDDTDDILALALICASPELELRGVSTVFGATAARARLARSFLAAAGKNWAAIPVAAGCGHPFCGASDRFWPNGPARHPRPVQLPCARPASALPRAGGHGVARLADELRARRGRIVPIGIGPLTNLATLLRRDPALGRVIPRLVLMAGEFRRPAAEWNVLCDPLAAAAVMASGIPIDLIPWSIGMACTVSSGQLDRLFAVRTRAGRLLARAVRLWQRAKSAPGRMERPHLFDPMAVAAVLHPEWFEWRRGRVTVSLSARSLARTRFAADARGPHRVAWSVRAGALRSVWQRILGLGRRPGWDERRVIPHRHCSKVRV